MITRVSAAQDSGGSTEGVGTKNSVTAEKTDISILVDLIVKILVMTPLVLAFALLDAPATLG